MFKKIICLQWLKLDELIEQERQIRQRMADRAGVLALMLHSTYNHDLMEQMSNSMQMAALEEEFRRQFEEEEKAKSALSHK